jgi:tetratricopeptide (TPR) repeat protein
VVIAALEGLAGAGSTEDTEAIVLVLEREDPAVLSAAVRALGRVGDARGIPALARLRERVSRSSLRADIEEADTAIRARLELRGEEPPAPSTGAIRVQAAAADAARASLRDPAGIRFRAWKDFWIGRLWLFFGALDRAIARFEAAAARRPTWVGPLTTIGLAYARRDRFALALAAFRRAIEIDRERVESNPTVARMLAQCFLRRADEVAGDGRLEIARGLLEEALALDLRLAPTSLRFEMGRRHDAMRLRSSV